MNVSTPSAGTGTTGGASSTSTRTNPFRPSQDYFDRGSWQDMAASQVSAVQDPRRNKVHQSSPLPQIFWMILSKLLGAKTHPGDRPVLATFLYLLTLASSITYGASYLYYIGYDAASTKTSRTYSSSAVDVILNVGYCALGLYGFELSYKIIITKSLRHSVRLHSRTVLKIPASLVMAGLVITTMLVSHFNKSDREERMKRTTLIGLPLFMFYLVDISRICLSILSGFWNFICGAFLLSICRTHTIAMRRLNRDLEFEGKIREHLYSLNFADRVNRTGHVDMTIDDVFPTAFVGDSEYMNYPLYSDEDVDLHGAETRRSASERLTLSHPQNELLDVARPNSDRRTTSLPTSAVETIPEDPETDTRPKRHTLTSLQLDAHRLLRSIRDHSLTKEELLEFLLDLDDLNVRYWKQNRRLQITSIVFQRWLASWIAFVIVWIFSILLNWIKSKMQVLDVFEIVLPIVLLVLICSAYAEVNNEGLYMLTCVYPTPERATFLRFIHQRPMQMTLFSSVMNYQVITTLTGTLAIAFSSKIILEQFS